MKYTSRSDQDTTQKALDVIQKFVNLWNAKALTQFGELFEPHAEYTAVTGNTYIGQEEIVSEHVYPFTTVNKDAVMTVNELLIRDLSDVLTMITGHWTVTGSTSPEGKALPPRLGVMHVVINQKNRLIRLVCTNDTVDLYSKPEAS
jgi:uncharacterized protein (TIGR02246 family)